MKVELLWCEVNIYPFKEKTILDERELSIVNLRLDKKKWREIAETHKLSDTRCIQIYKKALLKIGRVWQFGEKAKYYKG